MPFVAINRDFYQLSSTDNSIDYQHKKIILLSLDTNYTYLGLNIDYWYEEKVVIAVCYGQYLFVRMDYTYTLPGYV